MFVKKSEGSFNELIQGVQLKNLANSSNAHLVEVHFAAGAVIPEHKHPQEQTGFLLSGSLRFFGPGGEDIMLPGDSWHFGSSVPHGAEALEDSVVIEFFSPAREDYLELG